MAETAEVVTLEGCRARAALRRARAALLLALLAAIVSACAGTSARSPEAVVVPIRISEAEGQGDPARRASIRLTLEGLDADVAGDARRARGSYERAVQVDPTNPYVYLALARHHLEAGDGPSVVHFLGQASALFQTEGMREIRVEVHLLGLRGGAMLAEARDDEAQPYLDRAATLSPIIWGDGRLTAEELR
jgi:tetratricopeptide (TPR) repeat protein